MAQGRNGVLLLLATLVIFIIFVGEPGCRGSGLAVPLVVGIVAVGREPIAGMLVALKTGTVAVFAKEITGVGRAILNWGRETALGENVLFGERLLGEARWAGMAMKGAPPAEMGMLRAGGSLGNPI